MNNATASMQSTVSFLLLTTLCSTISPSHMHTLGRGMAEKKGSALSAARHNKYTKCFLVLPTGGMWQCLDERQWFGFSDCAACIKCLIAAVLLLCLEYVRTDIVGSMFYKVLTCCCSKKHSHSKLKSRYNFRTWFNPYYKSKGLSVKPMETKSNITCSPWERDGLTASDKTSRWETHQSPSSKLMDTLLKG